MVGARGESGRKNAPKLFMMANLKRGHCTVFTAPPAIVKDKSGEGCLNTIGLGGESCYMECEQHGMLIW